MAFSKQRTSAPIARTHHGVVGFVAVAHMGFLRAWRREVIGF
jgi:hypothetical protein